MKSTTIFRKQILKQLFFYKIVPLFSTIRKRSSKYFDFFVIPSSKLETKKGFLPKNRRNTEFLISLLRDWILSKSRSLRPFFNVHKIVIYLPTKFWARPDVFFRSFIFSEVLCTFIKSLMIISFSSL